ncbi:MAG: LTA synthase family protein [Rikenellaceae bacterium]|jgi:arylsulfatase A-like enzyme|nr:LTA synthase family protein [Rikenellaceae bacterium]
MKPWLRSDLWMVIRRVAVLYLALAVCRAVFYIYNSTLIGPLAWNEVPALLRGALQFDTVSILYAFGLWVVLALPPTHLRERKWYHSTLWWYYVVVAAAVVGLNMCDAVYFHYALKRATAEEFFFADNENTALLILRFMAENWYLVLLWAALVWGVVACYGRRIVPRTPIENPWVYYTVNTVILLGIIYLSFGGIRGGFTRTTRPITLSNATAYTSSPTKANLILSNPFCMLRTLGSGKITYVKYYTDEELAAIFTPYHYPSPPVRDFSLKGSNVVVFILESFSAEHSALLNPDLYPHGGGFTPFLDSLMRESFTFTDAHSNGRKSIEALPSILSSIPSFKTPFVLMPQALGPSRPLPRLLAEAGYATAFFCGSERGSMGFGAYATSAGIGQQYGREDYQKARGNDDHDGYWGIWDEPFLQYMGEVLTGQPQPFMAAVFTLSSHHPFVIPAQYADVLPQGFTKVHKGVAYTDMAVRKFFETYQNEAWFKNTVFVFAADHVSSEIYADKTRTPTGNSHIISFIYTHGARRAMYPQVSQQTDLMPTLLGMLDYEKPYFAFGRDILNEPERFPIAVNYMNQMFQGITDSVAVFFDEHAVTAAYARADTLQHHPVAAALPAVEEAVRQMKAIMQQYYRHVEQKNYTIPE